MRLKLIKQVLQYGFEREECAHANSGVEVYYHSYTWFMPSAKYLLLAILGFPRS